MALICSVYILVHLNVLIGNHGSYTATCGENVPHSHSAWKPLQRRHSYKACTLRTSHPPQSSPTHNMLSFSPTLLGETRYSTFSTNSNMNLSFKEQGEQVFCSRWKHFLLQCGLVVYSCHLATEATFLQAGVFSPVCHIASYPNIDIKKKISNSLLFVLSAPLKIMKQRNLSLPLKLETKAIKVKQ